ncbi:MAG: right-handed parallel beta-helix repeat-containing protein [Acidimicrobiia bacterium]|nr:right-handed parallel beta-helix repeat-containing protein [Acidimicrobiia bacterium]
MFGILVFFGGIAAATNARIHPTMPNLERVAAALSPGSALLAATLDVDSAVASAEDACPVDPGTDGTGTDGTGTDSTGTDSTGTDGTGTDGTGTDSTGSDGTGAEGTAPDGGGSSTDGHGDGAGTDGGGSGGAGTENPGGEATTGFPDASSTGPADESALVPAQSIKVTQDGAVIENVHITGMVTVDANDVVIRNVKITATGLYGIRSMPGRRGLVVEDTTIVGVTDNCSAAIAPNRYTARRLDISACRDGLKVGTDTTVEASYIHDLRMVAGSHADAIQAVGGNNIRIAGNRIEGPWRAQTSALILQADIAPLSNLVIENNLLSGGTYTMYIKAKSSQPPPSNVTVSGNVWIKNSYKFGSHSTPGAQILWSNNHFDDGSDYAYHSR